MQQQKAVVAEENIEIDPASEEYLFIIELTSLMQDIHTTGMTQEQEERRRELQELLKSMGLRVDFIEVAPDELSFTINRLH